MPEDAGEDQEPHSKVKLGPPPSKSKVDLLGMDSDVSHSLILFISFLYIPYLIVMRKTITNMFLHDYYFFFLLPNLLNLYLKLK